MATNPESDQVKALKDARMQAEAGLVSVRDTCEILGISTRTLYRWVKIGRFELVAVNGRSFIRSAAIEAHVAKIRGATSRRNAA